MGSYQVKLNGVLAGTAVTRKAALALVTLKFHGKDGVTVEHNGAIIWRSN